MAAVYKVRHNKLNTHFALKLLTMTSRRIEDRLIREGRVQASLRHPNVVSVVDVVEIDGVPGLVMEYIEGPALDAFLVGRELSVRDVLMLAQGIISGVQAAHEAGFVHRDLKPANVMLEIRGDVVTPKVTDFGLAKVVAGDDGMKATRSGMTMGTPPYMAPEQIRNAKDVDHRTDIFALGCILYEMGSGRQAYPGEDIMEIFLKISNSEREPLEEIAPHLPEPYIRAVKGALEVDRDERISSCSELAALLAECEDDPKASLKFSATFLSDARQLSQDVARSGVDSVGATNDWEGADGSLHEQSVPTYPPSDSPAPASADKTVQHRPAPAPTVAPLPEDDPTAPPPPPRKAASSVNSSMSESRSVVVGGLLGMSAMAVVGTAVVVLLLLVGGVWMYSQSTGASGDGASLWLPGFEPVEVSKKGGVEPGDKPGKQRRTKKKGGSATPEPGDVDPVAGLEPEPGDDELIDETTGGNDAVVSSSGCADHTAFEADAARGNLSNGDAKCLLDKMKDGSRSQTDRDKYGRVALRNFQVACEGGNARACASYESNQRYFFEKVTRSDADLLYTFASYLAKRSGNDQARILDASQWANKALGEKHQWKGGTHINRVDSLLEMRAKLANKRFQGDNNPKNRARAKNMAIEWANYRVDLGRSYKEAMDLCAQAAASRQVCEKQIYDQKATIVITLASMPPGAKLMVDGKDAGETPRSLELTYGVHEIKMVAGDKTGTKKITTGSKNETTWMWRVGDNTWLGQL